MKKLILFFFVLGISFSVNAQTSASLLLGTWKWERTESFIWGSSFPPPDESLTFYPNNELLIQRDGVTTQTTYQFTTIPFGPLNKPHTVLQLGNELYDFSVDLESFSYSWGTVIENPSTKFYVRAAPTPTRQKSWGNVKKLYR